MAQEAAAAVEEAVTPASGPEAPAAPTKVAEPAHDDELVRGSFQMTPAAHQVLDRLALLRSSAPTSSLGDVHRKRALDSLCGIVGSDRGSISQPDCVRRTVFQVLQHSQRPHLECHGLDHLWHAVNHLPVEGVDSIKVCAEAKMKAVGRFVQHQNAEIDWLPAR
jgi:hypothetical protein